MTLGHIYQHNIHIRFLSYIVCFSCSVSLPWQARPIFAVNGDLTIEMTGSTSVSGLDGGSSSVSTTTTVGSLVIRVVVGAITR